MYDAKEKYKYKVWALCPCQKCDVDSHGNSISFHITNRRQFGRNRHLFPWRVHVIYPAIICSPCRHMTWILNKGKSWYFSGTCYETMGFSVRIWFNLRPSCRQKDMRKSLSHFSQGYIIWTHFYSIWFSLDVNTESKLNRTLWPFPIPSSPSLSVVLSIS